MITVIDQAKPWLMPSSAFAAMIQLQLGPQAIMNGTGRPKSQPTMSRYRRPYRSARCPDTRLAQALTTPKLTMNETTIVVDAIRNSSEPISGTTVRSSPTIPPTNALTSTSRENCCQFSRRPSAMLVNRGARQEVKTAPPIQLRKRPTGIGGSQFARMRWRWGDIREHRRDERLFLGDAKRNVVPLLETDGRYGLTAQFAPADRARIGSRQHLHVIREFLEPL